jgi:hypothetical protein
MEVVDPQIIAQDKQNVGLGGGLRSGGKPARDENQKEGFRVHDPHVGYRIAGRAS